MIKKLLLKLAYKINKHYHTIEIQHEDCIIYCGQSYAIARTEVSKKVGYIDTLKIEARDISTYLKSEKLK